MGIQFNIVKKKYLELLKIYLNNENFCLVIGSNSFSGANFVNFILNKKIKVIGVSRSKELNKVFLPYKYNSNIKNFKFYKININKYKELKNLIKIIEKIISNIL